MTPVDEDRELDHRGPTGVAQRVECGADGAAGVQDVVDEDDERTVDTAGGHRRPFEGAVGFAAQVVAVERDVEEPDSRSHTGELGDLVGELLREDRSAGRDADDLHPRCVVGVDGGLLDDLVAPCARWCG